MFDPWYFSPYGNYMPYDWYHHYYSWYYNDFYYGWPYAYGYMGYGGYPWGYAHNNYRPGPDTPYRERENLRRIAPERQIASNNVRSGGSYRRTNPQIDQISGNRTERTRDIDNRTGIRTESGTTNYRRVNGNSGTDAVYRIPLPIPDHVPESLLTRTLFTADLPICHREHVTIHVPVLLQERPTRATAAVFTGALRSHPLR